MPEREGRNCPACGGSERAFKGRKNAFDIFSCNNCRTLFADRRAQETDRQNYDEYYSAENLDVPDFVVARVNQIVGGFEGFRRVNRLLDVGFGAGTILDAASQKGWETNGVEVSKQAVEQAREQGHDVVHGTLRSAKYPDGYFDVVTASEIVEHLDDSIEDLREISRILRPGGVFWGTTPSSRGISGRLLGANWSEVVPPEHMQIYSKRGLEIILRTAGFRRVTIRTHGTNPIAIFEHFRLGKQDDVNASTLKSAYQLNKALTRGPVAKAVKATLNFCLELTRLGDSLKFHAFKP